MKYAATLATFLGISAVQAADLTETSQSDPSNWPVSFKTNPKPKVKIGDSGATTVHYEWYIAALQNDASDPNQCKTKYQYHG